MIKKIVLVMMVLLFAFVPVVSGDAGGAPRPVDGKIIDIEIKALTDEISIGEPATLEITITNLTQYTVSPVRMYLGFMWFKIDYDEDMLNIDTDDLKLGAYESITFEITDTVSEYLDWYKVGDDCYIDIEAEINFFVDDAEHTNYDYNYQIAEEVITLKINNLYDGNEYVEIEWLDDRDTAYYFDYMDDDYYDDGSIAMRTVIKVCYEMKFINYSGAEIFSVPPYTEMILNDHFFDYHMQGEIEDSYTFDIKPVFCMDGKYYYIEKSRTYNTQAVEAPDVVMNIEAEAFENEDGLIKYIVTVKNVGESTLHNFIILERNSHYEHEYISREYGEPNNLPAGETAKFEFYWYEDDNAIDVYVGYLMDGMVFFWDFSTWVRTSDSGDKTFDISYGDYRMLLVDYEYEMRVKEETEITPNPQTPTPSPQATIEVTPTITPTSEISPTATAEIVVTNRQNPMLWLLIIVLVMAIVAVVLIIRVIVKQGKEQSSDD